MIKIENINQSYGEKQVLNNLNLEIKENKITALIGPNGAGKSTLLSVISRLVSPTSGSVSLDGENIFAMKSVEVAKKLAVLRQNNQTFVKLTVDEIVAFGRFPYSKGRLTKRDKEIIDEALDYLDLKSIRNSYINNLSGGQQQRVYIAMILAQDTKYIFLDEPLNNLDMKYAVELMIIMQKLVLERNKTIVIVVHDINMAAAFADHIVAMKDGVIINEGSVNEMIDKSVLDYVFDHDFCIAGVNGKKICVYNDLAYNENKIGEKP